MTAPTAGTPIPVTTRDGRALFAERIGDGTPIVVFEAGMGGSRNSWGAIAPVIGERTTSVVYDRSGLGRSAPDPSGVRDLARLTDDLVDVLGALGDGPFVLVGHSWGGPIIRGAAAALPDRIAGLVLVDPTDERCDLFFSKANERQARWAPGIMNVMARVGLLNRAAGKLAANLPEPWATNMRSEDGTRASIVEQLAELEPSTRDLQRLRDEPLTLPDVPVTIISGAKPGRMERGRRPELIAAHVGSATALPQGRHVLAQESSHYIPFTEPAVVIDEIVRILDSRPS